MEALRIFVSHSSQDKAIADTFVHGLREAGADVWYDEHNLGAGHLKNEIQRELDRRPIFIVLLSKAAFASSWVKRETDWADDLTDRDPTRLMLPVTVGPIERSDFSGQTGWLFLHAYRRVEAPGYRPYPMSEAIRRTLRLLGLTPHGEQPLSSQPQPQETAADLLARGKALTAQRQYAEALPLFQRVTQLDPHSFDAWMNLGFTLRQLKRDKEDALTSYEHAVSLDVSRANAWTGKGLALYDLGRYSEALTAFERAIQLDNGTYAYAWNGKGIALHRLGQDNDAVNAFEEAISRNSKIALFWGNKAISLRALGRGAEAQEAERRAKELGG